MANDFFNVDKEDLGSSEETAKASRGVNWALLSIGAFVVITVFLFIAFFISAAKDGSVETPSQIENSNSR
jgi:hypothetical protein